MDGTHNLCKKMKDSPAMAMWSYKLKDFAYNILVKFLSFFFVLVDGFNYWLVDLGWLSYWSF